MLQVAWFVEVGTYLFYSDSKRQDKTADGGLAHEAHEQVATIVLGRQVYPGTPKRGQKKSGPNINGCCLS
jgi:hypothetical protein